MIFFFFFSFSFSFSLYPSLFIPLFLYSFFLFLFLFLCRGSSVKEETLSLILVVINCELSKPLVSLSFASPLLPLFLSLFFFSSLSLIFSPPGKGAQLAISRSFGDFEFGEVVTAAPSLSILDLSTLPEPSPPSAPNQSANILILACDGVWDVLTDEEAIKIVRGAGEDMTLASVMLRDYAYLRDSGDDLTVVCVCLDRIPERF